jgi:hypothetical protein
MDEDLAIWTVRHGSDVKLPPIERMGRIGHFERAVRVVEGGINIGYCSTIWIMTWS